MVEEILPSLYRAEIPLPQNPLKWLNAYIVKGEDRFLIIDTGFNREECLQAMHASLRELGVDLNKTDFFITHLHADHMGLLDRLVSENAKVYFNEPEALRARTQRVNGQKHWEETLAVYIANGFAADAALTSMLSHPARQYRAQGVIDFTIVNDGDGIDMGDYHFRCVATPGHSPGHMCLYEAEKKILVAGDHILFDITPNITYWLEMEDSLRQYLASLEKIDAFDAALVLPGHRRLVHDLRRRVRELQEHHQARLQEVMAAIGGGEKNILQTVPHIRWDITAKTWEDFPPAQKWFAFGETLAHVNYLVGQGKVRRKKRNGMTTYTLA